jgi:protein-glutamine gamma-glutamyltransferase
MPAPTTIPSTASPTTILPSRPDPAPHPGSGDAAVPATQLRSGGPAARIAGAAVVVAAGFGGLLFAPVFGLRALAVPVAAVVAAVALTDQATGAKARRAGLRILFALAVGLVALVVTLPADGSSVGVPTAATLRAVATGAISGWARTLDSTWPARPDPSLLAFVPLLVLVAAVLGVELLSVGPLAALTPGVLVCVLAQTFAPATGRAAWLGAGGPALCALAVLLAARPPRSPAPARAVPPAARSVSRAARSGRAATGRAMVAPALLLLLVIGGLVTAGGVDPLAREPFSVKDSWQPRQTPSTATSPLDEIATRLQRPGQVVFSDRADGPVDRWPLVVLDTFDGQNWATSQRFQPMGRTLPDDPAVTVTTRAVSATVTVDGLPGPWLPSHSGLRDVEGIAPLVGSAATLLADGAAAGLQYRLTWLQPQVSGRQVETAELAADTGPLLPGPVPAAFTRIARTAVPDPTTTLAAALQLESYLRHENGVAEGSKLPTGHSYAQLEYFLTTSHRGTSEQFATAYVILARLLGLPSRLVVGFRQPSRPGPDGSFVVRNAEVLAWPEVLVSGIGWVPLDPTDAAARDAGAAKSPLASAIDQSRNTVTGQPGQPRAGTPSAGTPARVQVSGSLWSRLPVLLLGATGAALVVVALVLLATPLVKAVRRRRRRRAVAAAGVVGAWQEVRDRLSEHGAAVGPVLTPRDVAVGVDPLLGGAAAGQLRRLGHCLDLALWSGDAVPAAVVAEAWSACDAIRRGLRRRPWRARLRAAVDVGSLLRGVHGVRDT